VDFAAEDGDFDVHQREAQRAAPFALRGEHFKRGSEELFGQHAAGSDTTITGLEAGSVCGTAAPGCAGESHSRGWLCDG